MLPPTDAEKLRRWLERPDDRDKFRKDHADCERSRMPYYLLGDTGEVVPVRCSSPNRCDPCAKRRSRENAEMIGLDALEHPDRAPEVWLVLTTRTATLDMAEFYNARRRIMDALKRRWDGVTYASVLEYTTGYGPRAGGQRRPHWNVLLKGLTDAELHELEPIAREIWCRHVDALPEHQYAAGVWEVGGLAGYLAAHVHKADQKPPPAFRGQRFNCGRDYFEGCTRAQMRERAAASVFRKAIRFRAGELADDPEHELHGATEEELEAWTDAQEQLLRSIDWRLVRMGHGWMEEVLPRPKQAELGNSTGRRRAWDTEQQVAAALRARDEHEEENPC